MKCRTGGAIFFAFLFLRVGAQHDEEDVDSDAQGVRLPHDSSDELGQDSSVDGAGDAADGAGDTAEVSPFIHPDSSSSRRHAATTAAAAAETHSPGTTSAAEARNRSRSVRPRWSGGMLHGTAGDAAREAGTRDQQRQAEADAERDVRHEDDGVHVRHYHSHHHHHYHYHCGRPQWHLDFRAVFPRGQVPQTPPEVLHGYFVGQAPVLVPVGGNQEQEQAARARTSAGSGSSRGGNQEQVQPEQAQGQPRTPHDVA